ncbi:MAG: XdhC/CoxI family protein [Desulfotignum sp.]|nr:XdhC/CoxI family protein [Desulfotignum sp.]MCF8136657.1 XdhC/CoxI family protein [Desulfotignum sp.]
MDIHVRIVELLKKEKIFCLATVLTSNISDVRPGQKAIVYDKGDIVGSLGSTKLDSDLAGLAQKAFKENKSQVAEIEAGVKFFLNILSPDAQLILCGAGHIAIPLARFAQPLKFRVVVIDDRPDFASPSRFPNCKIIAEDFTAALRDYHFSSNTYVVVITRGHEHDADCLIEILKKKTVYVGLIGSRRRVRFVLEMLAEKGYSRARIKDVFTPIGLPIGAESPEEIALSIVSELVCVRRKGSVQARALRNAVGIDL